MTDFEAALLSTLRSKGKKLLAKIAKDQKLTDETEKELHEFMGAFAETFTSKKAA